MPRAWAVLHLLRLYARRGHLPCRCACPNHEAPPKCANKSVQVGQGRAEHLAAMRFGSLLAGYPGVPVTDMAQAQLFALKALQVLRGEVWRLM